MPIPPSTGILFVGAFFWSLLWAAALHPALPRHLYLLQHWRHGFFCLVGPVFVFAEYALALGRVHADVLFQVLS